MLAQIRIGHIAAMANINGPTEIVDKAVEATFQRRRRREDGQPNKDNDSLDDD